AVLDALRAPDMASCVAWCEARPASRAALERVHSARYLDSLERVAGQGGGVLDADTVMSADSWNAAVAAAGVAIGAVERAIVAGSAFAAARPPGHHALPARAMGFCLINNVVVAARHAQQLDKPRWTTVFRERVAPAPVVGVLEGGYRLDLLAAGARAHVRALA